MSKQIIEKGLWAPVVQGKGKCSDWIDWQCIASTRKLAQREFLIGVSPENHEDELKNVTFRRVYVAVEDKS